MENKETILTTKELAEYLKVSERHIVNLRNDKKIPFYKIGVAYRYKLSEIEKVTKG